MNRKINGFATMHSLLFISLVTIFLISILSLINSYSRINIGGLRYLQEKNKISMAKHSFYNDLVEFSKLQDELFQKDLYSSKKYSYEYAGVKIEAIRKVKKNGIINEVVTFYSDLSEVKISVKRMLWQFNRFDCEAKPLTQPTIAYCDYENIPKIVRQKADNFFEGSNDYIFDNNSLYILDSDAEINMHDGIIDVITINTAKSFSSPVYIYNNKNYKISIMGQNSVFNPLFIISDADVSIGENTHIYCIMYIKGECRFDNYDNSTFLGLLCDPLGKNRILKDFVKSKDLTITHMMNPIVLDEYSYTIYE